MSDDRSRAGPHGLAVFEGEIGGLGGLAMELVLPGQAGWNCGWNCGSIDKPEADRASLSMYRFIGCYIIRN